jgi:hypothetical protein
MIVSIVAMAADSVSGLVLRRQRKLADEFRHCCPIQQRHRVHIETDGAPRRAA